MAEKTVSKYLINLEKQFAVTDPVLQKAAKAFRDLDQLEFDMGLIGNDETTARKASWWPLISTLGGYSPAKSDFIARYLGSPLFTARHKFTVLQFTPQSASATLPGTALDADHRLPFYQIGREIEQLAGSEGNKLNSYLELVTVNSPLLKNKLVIDTPVMNTATETPVTTLLRRHVMAISDLVLVFTDLFDADAALISETVAAIVAQQDSNKFLFIVDHSEIHLDAAKTQEITASWQRRLADVGILSGQLVVLCQSNATDLIDQRINNLGNDRSYRVLANLEKSIRDVDDVLLQEVENALVTWKDRCNATTLIVMAFFVMLLIFAEIATGVLDLLFDPIIGPIAIVVTALVFTPLHLMISRVHGKFIINQLHKRQKQLNVVEDLAGLFEKSLSFWRMLLPSTTPVGKNKATRQQLSRLIEQTKDLTQALNDQFSHSQFLDPRNPADSLRPDQDYS